MTQKEKLIKSFLTTQSIRRVALNIERECAEYSSTAVNYAKDIVTLSDALLKILK